MTSVEPSGGEPLTISSHIPDWSGRSVGDLLSDYALTLAELRRRGVVRSNNAPAGDYAEWLVAKALGGELAGTFSEKSWDVLLPTGSCVQVKTRVTSAPVQQGQLQTSPFRSWDFESAAFVLLGGSDYRVVRAVLLPVAIAQEHARWHAHVNGSVVMMNAALLGHEAAEDITNRLNEAATLA